MKKSAYEALGASAQKEGIHRALDEAGIKNELKLFAQISEDIAGDSNYYSFIHCDGAGTKSIVAYLLYKETNDPNVFAGLAQDALVMNLDDIYCIGRPQNLLLANAIARNSKLIGDDIIAVLIKEYNRLGEVLNNLGIPLKISGGETADCGDLIKTILVDSVISGRIHKDNLISTLAIEDDDVIIGIESCGQASYEDKPNSGIASNGLTLARHALLSKENAIKFPEILDSQADKEIAYQGKFNVTSKVETLSTTVGEALISPTRTYSPILDKVYSELNSEIHAVIHNTGGALTKVKRFGTAKKYVKYELFETPEIFSLIQKTAEIPWREMYEVFNMGHRIEIYCNKKHTNTIIDICKSFNLRAKQIGYVEPLAPKANNEVVIKSQNTEFTY